MKTLRLKFTRQSVVIVILVLTILFMFTTQRLQDHKDIHVVREDYQVNVLTDKTHKIGTDSIPYHADIADEVIKPHGKFKKDVKLVGMVFNDDSRMGDLSGEFSSSIDTSLVKSFSPHVENHLKNIFNDEYKESDFYATIPAMIQRNENVYIVQRVWLGQYEKMRTKLRKEGRSEEELKRAWKNTWQENYLYEMELDSDYNLIRPGNIMGLPTTTNSYFNYKSDGPMDPRLFAVGEDMYLLFHTWLVDPDYNGGDMAGRPHIYDLNRHVKRKLKLDVPMQRAEINWIPIDVDGEMHFTYSLDPLRVMKCNPESGSCSFIYEQPGSKENPFNYVNDHLRGGTPWILYKYPYYISMAHNVASPRDYDKGSIYNMNLVVLSVNPWRIVYVSRFIMLDDQFLKSSPVVRNHTISFPFFYPMGLVKWTDDIVDVSGHLNDANGHILRFSGIQKLMAEVIKHDSTTPSSNSTVVRTIQQYVLEGVKAFVPSWAFSGDIIKGTYAKR